MQSDVQLTEEAISVDPCFLHKTREMVKKKKDPAAVRLGRKGGKQTAKNLTPQQRSEIARKAAVERWKRIKGSSTE